MIPEFQDPNRKEHDRYLGVIRDKLAALKPGEQAAYAAPAFEREIAAIEARLTAADAKLPAVKKARGALDAANEKHDAAFAAVNAATEVDALIRARAALELTGRVLATRSQDYRSACAAACVGSPERYALYGAFRKSLAVVSDIRGVHGILDGATISFGAKTSEQNSAARMLRAHAVSVEPETLAWVAASGVDFADDGAAYFWETAMRRNAAAAE